MSTKVIIITGAATELGRDMAQRMVLDGHHVVLGDPDVLGGREVERELAAHPGSATYVPTSPDADGGAQELLEYAVRRFGRVDAALNAAWVAPSEGMLHELDAEYFDRTLSVALHEVHGVLRAQLRHFRANGGGVIVNTTSVEAAGAGGHLWDGTVSLTAGMIEVLSRQAAIEYACDNIRVRSFVSTGFETARPHPDPAGRRRAADQIATQLREDLDAVGTHLGERPMTAAG